MCIEKQPVAIEKWPSVVSAQIHLTSDYNSKTSYSLTIEDSAIIVLYNTDVFQDSCRVMVLSR